MELLQGITVFLLIGILFNFLRMILGIWSCVQDVIKSEYYLTFFDALKRELPTFIEIVVIGAVFTVLYVALRKKIRNMGASNQ